MTAVSPSLHHANLQNTKRKPLGVRVTAEQHSVLVEAARREHRSVSSFVLQAALQAAGTGVPRKRSIEEVRAMLEAAQAEVAAAVPPGRSFLKELTEERRREAAHE